MLQVLGALLIGIAIGVFFNLTDKQKSMVGKLQTVGVFSLLFVMGISVGINPNIISNLSDIGLKALVLAVLSTLFSIVFVYFITNYITKKQNNK